MNEKQILEEATQALARLLQEEKIAEAQKARRDLDIRKAKAVIDLFTTPEDIAAAVQATNELLFAEKPTTPSNVPEPPLPPTEFVYAAKATWQERIKAYFKFKNRVLSIGQIWEEFIKHEPGKDKDSLKGVISNTVAVMVKKGLLKSYDPPEVKTRGYYYGNPLWFDDNTLKDEYKPNLKEQLLW